MLAELYSTTDYPLSERGIIIPNEIKNELTTETRSNFLNIFIENLNIQHEVEDFASEFISNLSRYLQQEISFLEVLDSEYLRERIHETLSVLYVDKPEIFYKLYFHNQNQYVVVGEIAINFHDILRANFELSHHAYIEAYNLGIIEHSVAWNFLEGDNGFLPERNEGFTLSQAIEILGLNEDIRTALDIIFTPSLTDDEYSNLEIMLRAILLIESSGGWNIDHYTGASSADGYFQYLTENGRYEGEDWLTNSYETALRSLNTELVSMFSIFETELSKIENNVAGQIVSDLDASEQIILFLSDITRNGRIEVVRNFLQNPSRENFINIYKLHHTNISDEDTQRVISERLDGYFE